MAGSSERIRQIQEEIARREAGPEKAPEETQPILVFSLAGEEYGFPLAAVREVSRVGSITSLPGLPPAVLGAMGLRGEVLPVLDLRRLLGLEEQPLTAESRLVIVRNGTVTAALLTDQVADIAALPQAALQPAPLTASGEAPAFLQGIAREGEKTTRLLDVAHLLEAVRHGK